jgi:hypothetical protein
MKLHLLEQVMEEVLKEMPAFPENRESAPEARLREKLEAAEKGALGNEKRGTNTNNDIFSKPSSACSSGILPLI